ncbi:uncharacterized protein LOC130809873 [Amaranthus tricolor]|uniref:uncharacterized protein LOC130809873 n=1 Tax=Amaranthus tricolor TaxID=29722 RepID=UPI00258A7C2C|nr:uncharacterized protein LOC130809873 [Amaranthus tricolor]
MEEQHSTKFRKTHFANQQCNAEFQAISRNKGKSCSSFLLKFFLVALFLSLLPLFPSDPPEFISHTIFAKSWELIHLLIIGILLSYGLFSRPKTHQTPLKTHLSQPYASNLLHHSSIFDYEEDNPPGVSCKNAIPTKSFNLSSYRTGDLRGEGENCKNFDEKPLGLPVRSLRSRVVESDGEEEEKECTTECESGSESDMSGENFTNTSMPNNEKVEENAWKSDFFRAETGKFEAKQAKFESFRSPTQEGSSCQKFTGFCSWLPESPNMVEREILWRENNFYMPFTNFTQANDFNLLNPQTSSTDYFMPSAAVPASVPFSTSDFASGFRKYNHVKGHWGDTDSGFCMPSTSVPSPMSVPGPATDFGFRSRRYNYEAENWCKSPNLQDGIFGRGNPNLFMPLDAFPPSMPASAIGFDSSHLKKKDGMRSESNKDTPHLDDLLSGKKLISFPVNGNSSIEASRNADFNQNLFMNNIEGFPSVPSPVNDFAGASVNQDVFMNTIQALPSVPSPVNEVTASVKASRSSSSNQDFFVNTTQVLPSVPSRVAGFSASSSARCNQDIFTNTTEVLPSVPSPINETTASVKASKSASFNQDFSMNTIDVLPSVSSPAKTASVKASRSARLNQGFHTNATEVLSSVPSPSVESAASGKPSRNARLKQGAFVKKEEEKSEQDNMGSLGEGSSSYAPYCVKPIAIPAAKADVSWKKNEKKSAPERWDDDCFVIQSSEINSTSNSVQANPSSLELSYSSETLSSARSSSRISFHEQKPLQELLEENVQWSAPTNNSVIEDLNGENDSYKPSPPSPPPQVQTRSHVVDSSIKALDIQTLVSNDDQRSPPTSEGRKALSKASHSRRFSCGSFFDRDLRKSFKDEAKEANRKTKGDDQFARGSKCGCLMLDVKPTLNKTDSKGKSVRTIRPKEISHDRQKNDHNEQKLEEYNEGERKGEKQEVVVIQIGIKEKRSNSNGRRGEKLQKSGETSIVVGLSSNKNSNGTAVVPVVNDVTEEENDSEIDKKADEFIAKFKEQIRLQKVGAKGDSRRHNQKSLYHT